MIRKVDHIGIVVKNLDDSLAKYEKLFHVKAQYVETHEEYNLRVAFLAVGETMIELLQPLTFGKGRQGEFLKEHGESVSHIAFRVDDIERVLTEMKQAGVKLVDETPRIGAGGSRIALISPEEINNVVVELVERKEEIKKGAGPPIR